MIPFLPFIVIISPIFFGFPFHRRCGQVLELEPVGRPAI
jgi:hypothetical protein